MPMLSTVSIMPGIENLAPERTETSSGFAGSPSVRPILASRLASCSVTWSAISGGTAPPLR